MSVSITNENFQKEILSCKLPVVLEVYATWCGPCQHMLPIFDSTAKELGNKYKFAKLNVDEARDISIRYGVTSVPTILFLKEGKVEGKETGYMNKEELKTKIEKYLD